MKTQSSMNTKQFVITPKVVESQEFIEIATDFSNRLDIVREAISNAYDAKANNIEILFDVIDDYGMPNLRIVLQDDGTGMDKDGLQSFFDLGNSLRRNSKEHSEYIGEKGHGTKIYLNSRKIVVTTTKNGVTHKATLNEPFKTLYDNKIPSVYVTQIDTTNNFNNGTRIEIYGYNSNQRQQFTHERLKDYILWFTKHGSVDNVFYPDKYKHVKVHLKGLGRDDVEILDWGHVFPKESENSNELFDKHLADAPNHFSKIIKKQGYLKNSPEVKYEAIFAIEGTKVKYDYNKMIRRKGYVPPKGAYTIQERYGLWLCKDFIPVQRKNEWITSKGSEYTKFHAFFNCQALKLTANRGSVENTRNEIMKDIENEVKEIYNQILSSEDWANLTYLEDEALGYNTVAKEKQNYILRLKNVNRANIAEYKNLHLVEPQKEAGVYALCLQLMVIEPDLFPFQILDYDTHEGIDVIAKASKTVPIQDSRLFYVEFKMLLANNFNHSFENLYSVICWDTKIKHDEIVTDIAGSERKLEIVPPKDTNDYTRYFLNDPRKAHKIEVFVLKQYLKQQLGIDFKPRTADDIY